MSRVEKIKKIVLIILGLGLSAYLIYGGFSILKEDNAGSAAKTDPIGKVHSDAVK